MNGEDLCLIKALERQVKVLNSASAIASCQKCRDDFIIGRPLTQIMERLLNPLTSPIAQFLRSRLGERNREDLSNCQLALQDQAQNEAGDRVGLAGPRAGLNQGNSRSE